MTTSGANINVNVDRLWDTLDASAQIGKGRGSGLRRLALTDSDHEMRQLFVSWCEDAGLTVGHDAMGNIFARREGTKEGLDPVVIGSHLDTQVAGGRFDGILGVLSGLEIARTLNDHGIETNRSLEVVCWTNEEGARFQPPMMGSAVFSGALDLGWTRDQVDDEGITVGSELDRLGYADGIVSFGRTFDSYFELHIEQAPELERTNVPVGIVVGSYKSHGLRVELTGRTGHSGPTEMADRRDALAAGAKIVSAVFDIGFKYSATGGKSTSPCFIPWPNKPGIISEYVMLTADCRHPDPEVADAMLADIESAVHASAEQCGVQGEIIQRWTFGDVEFSEELIAALASAAATRGIETKQMLSQAGHDAYNIAKIAPTALIFTPCHEGISHNEEEDINRETTVPGVNVMLHAVLDRLLQ